MDYFLRTYDEEYHWQWSREYPSIGTTVLHPSMNGTLFPHHYQL